MEKEYIYCNHCGVSVDVEGITHYEFSSVVICEECMNDSYKHFKEDRGNRGNYV